MAEGEEGWTWPSWGSSRVEEQIMPPVAEEEAEVKQEVEVGGIEEQIMEVKKEAEVEQEVQTSGVEEQFVVVKDEADEVEEEFGVDDEVLQRRARLQVLLADLDRRRAHQAELFAKAEYIRTHQLVPTIYTSTCEGCLRPAVCKKCGVRGDLSIFLCLGCRLPAPQVLRCCDVCANPIQPNNTCCKHCATTVAVNSEGTCTLCGRSPSKLSKEEDDGMAVPETEAD